jgi:purine nucleoside phosphorylase
LGIKSLANVCYVKIGTEIFINTNKVGSLNAIKEKYGIVGDYTIQVEVDLKKQYPFMNTNKAD